MKYHTITKEAAVVFRRIIFWAGITVCAVSCRDEELMPGTDTGGFIVFRVREGNPVVATRAASGNECDSSFTSLSGSIPMIVGADTIEMGFSVERNRDMIFADKPHTLTRGASFGSDDGGMAVTNFHVMAFQDKVHQYAVYFGQKEIPVSGGFGRTGIYWPAGSLSFCAYAWSTEGADELVSGLEFNKTDVGLSGSFNYSLPEVEEDNDKRNDPANQPDLIFAMTPDMVCEKNGRTEPVDLLFHHALSAVVFKVGTLKAESVILKSIALENFYGGGSCTISTGTIESVDDYNDRQDVKFEWTPSGEQNKKYLLGLGDEGQQAETGDMFGKDVETKNGECTFMMIPQNIGSDSKIVLNFVLQNSGTEYTFEKNMNEIEALKPNGEGDARLLPDTKYIFTIGLNGDVDITVEDNVTGLIKNELTIQNTGIANGYIRAAIVGYWADGSGNVMGAWDEENDGTFTGLAGENWKKGKTGEDVFWYYTKTVPHYGFTTPLFTTYELKEEAIAGHPNQTLILDVVAQIVIDDKREEAGWPTTFEP